MTKQEALNKAAQEFGYKDWVDLLFCNRLSSNLQPYLDLAMDIYAGEQSVEFGEFIRRDYTKTMGGGQWLRYGEQKHVSNTTEQLFQKYKNNPSSNSSNEN